MAGNFVGLNMAFNLNLDIKGVFPVSNGSGPTAQGLALSQTAINTILKGINPDGTPGASVPAALPAPQAPPITRRAFSLGDIFDKAKANPLVTLAIVAAIGYAGWRLYK